MIKEIDARLGFLLDVGLDYLSLDRPAGTLAGGAAHPSDAIGLGLVGVLYVLDEPSIGLHQRDNHRLIETSTRLRDLGNTLIVVEHDEDTISTPTGSSTSARAPGSTAAWWYSGLGQGVAGAPRLAHGDVPLGSPTSRRRRSPRARRSRRSP